MIGILAMSLTAGEAFSRLGIFLLFGLGIGLPLLALSFLSGAAQRWITHFFAQQARAINLFAGLLLVGTGFYDLWSNWDPIRTFLM